MKTLQTFDPADPNESEIYAFDFARRIAPADALATTQWSISVLIGADAVAASRLDGAALIEGTKTCQRITRLAAGVTYLLNGRVTTVLGETMVLSSTVSCISPG